MPAPALGLAKSRWLHKLATLLTSAVVSSKKQSKAEHKRDLGGRGLKVGYC